MRIYANRYGMIESFELAFALQRAAEQRRVAGAARELRALRRDERRALWSVRRRRAAAVAGTLVEELRAALLRHAV
jgi:hypothetical protein